MPKTEIWKCTACEIARDIHSKSITATEVTVSALARLDEVNPQLNAVVDVLADEARARAAALDEAQASGGQIGPLHGVPVTIKINVDQKGHATNNGVTALKDLIAPDDAPVVRNLLVAGAVIIGRTNTPEFSFRADTDNPLFGRTHNPWGRHLSAGGSSGGAGSAVMAGIGALAHGNDIGGSLRFPAAAVGAVSIKPGLGRVPAYNPSQKEERGILAQHMSVQGLIARNSADLALSTPSIIAPDPHDPFHVPLPYQGPKPLHPIRVAFTKETYGFDLHPSVSHALDRAADALAQAGYEVEECLPPMLHECAMDGYRSLLGEVKVMMGQDIKTHGSSTVQAIFDEYFRQFPPYQGDELLQILAKRSHYARAWSLFLQEYPLVLTPFLPQPFFAPNRDTEGADGVREVLGAALWSYSVNFMGLPAGNLPAHLAHLPQGPCPINVQIIGRRWREDMVIDAMQAIEQRLPPLAPTLWQQMNAD